MNEQITAALITGAFSIAASLLVVALPLHLKNRRLNSELRLLKEAKDSVSHVALGLAVGYYFNFVSTIFEALRHSEIKILLNDFDALEKGTPEFFSKKNIEVVCIVPEKLSGGRIDQCFDLLHSFNKGAIIRGEKIRNFSINYSIRSRGSDRVLQIYDIAKPLFAAKNYMEEFQNIRDGNPIWDELSDNAVNTFRATLDRLRKTGQATGLNQFLYHEIK